VYRFQSKIDERDIPVGNQRVFWDPLYIFLLVWLVLIVLSILSGLIPHVLICMFNFGLLKFNFDYFSKCYERRNESVNKLFSQHGHDKMSPYYRGSFISNLTPASATPVAIEVAAPDLQ